MQALYNHWIVALSYVVAVLASYVALDMASRLSASKDTEAARYWLYGGSTAMGAGIWSMHFVGMLAFSLPIPVPYNLPVTLLSLLFAIAASYVALSTINRGTLNSQRLLTAGVVMGSGVALMHYTGMAALEIRPRPTYDPLLFSLSLLIAIAASVAAMWISFQLKSQTLLTAFWKKSASALVMGIAIWGMHFTAMAAAQFAEGSYCLVNRGDFDQQWLAVAVGICAFLILATTMVVSIIDARMTERRHTLEAESERFFNQSPNLLCVVSSEGLLKRINPAWQSVLGYPRGALLQQPFAQYVHPDDLVAVQASLQQISRGAPTVSLECRRRCADGRYKSLLWNATPLLDGQGFYATGHDITQRRVVEDRLRLLETAVSRLNDIVLITEAEPFHEPGPKILFVNDAFERRTGYTREEVIGKSPRMLQGPATQRAELDRIGAALKCWKPVRAELINYTKAGEAFWVELEIVPIADETGWYTHWVAVERDITERKALEDQLRQSQKLDAVGRLAAGVAHEINTPVQFVNDSCHFVRDGIGDLQALLGQYRQAVQATAEGAQSAEAAQQAMQLAESNADVGYLMEHLPKAVERSLEGLQRVATIVRSMKEFAHPDQNEKAYVDLNHAIESTLVIARNEYKYVAEVQTDLGDIPPVCCFLGDLNQAVLNMVVNAAHAIEDTVRGSDRLGLIHVVTRQQGDDVLITIGDNGSGIPESARAHIFDPFFTTKAVGKGTGQGLAIARTVIVDKHQGELRFETEMGVGTRFIIRLPIHPARRDVAEPA